MPIIHFQDIIKKYPQLDSLSVEQAITKYEHLTGIPIVGCMIHQRYVSLSNVQFPQRPEGLALIPADSFQGRRILEKTLIFLVRLASHRVKIPGKFIVHHVVNNSLLCQVKNCPDLKMYVDQFKQSLLQITQENLVFTPSPPPEELADILLEQNDYAMANLIAGKKFPEGLFHYHIGRIHFVSDYPLAPDHSLFREIRVQHVGQNIFVQPVYTFDPHLPVFYAKQKKLFEIFQEYDHWVSTMGIHYLDRLNKIIRDNHIKEIININEAFHEKNLADIARLIYEKRDIRKIILIAGPSSSGKTTFSKRLSIHLRTYGLSAIPLSLDNYFVDREKTPLDEDGKPDFEHIQALDLDLLNNHLLDLLDGKKVSIPRFNFKIGRRDGIEYELQLQPSDILIIEGIHGLNDRLTEAIPSYMKFKIYISPITPLNIDHYLRISSTDNRLIRRIVRDSKYRNHDAEKTLDMWDSVRKGEEKNIFPFQEEADVMFNSALIYELSALKPYAEENLQKIPPDHPHYPEALRLLSLLALIEPLDQEKYIPPTSILREFIGGSSISY